MDDYNEGIKAGFKALAKFINEESEVKVSWKSIDFEHGEDTTTFTPNELQVSCKGVAKRYFEAGIETGMQGVVDFVNSMKGVSLEADSITFEVDDEMKDVKFSQENMKLSHPGRKGFGSFPKRSTSVSRVERDRRTGLIKQTVEETEYYDE